MLTHILRLSILGVLSLPLAFGQTDAARLTGTVTDPSGAVIPAATITIQNEKTGQSRKIQTNEQGHYLATPLLPSSYSLTVDVPGMAKAEYKANQPPDRPGTRARYPHAARLGFHRGQCIRR